ncbi:hypothetical protein GCM10022219_09870 [Microbacterium oryzae]|uniref:Uncharacterized protein n=1 Tax=Microbacterium oryzae TaxID=743009 RepID=A0A6I6DQ09_9MICO|nr:hypothetical protein [Microbacterium oryzae]QGU27045.1 hypothetical protein D7D94_04725 [Microbacterium oryzae]
MTSSVPRRRTPGWVVAVIAGLFALLYAYAVWSAVTYLVTLVQATSAQDISLSAIAWVVLILAVLVPIAAFAVAFGLGRTRGALWLSVSLLAGLALTAVFWLDMQAFTANPSNLF